MSFDVAAFQAEFARLKRHPCCTGTSPSLTPICARFQPPLLLFDDVAQAVEQAVRRMVYDDALQAWGTGYRLEYVALEYGLPHYRLYHRRELIGLVDVRSAHRLPVIHRNLAAYLAGLGFTPRNIRLVECGARTALNAEKWRLPQLFSIYPRLLPTTSASGPIARLHPDKRLRAPVTNALN